jgi:cytochrome bd-type quinol oxidase subunit 2
MLTVTRAADSPLLLMLAGPILRGAAFEYRYKTERMRWIWDTGFAGGSLVAAFMQGMTIGALVEGLPISNGQYTGGEFAWFSPFAVLCGIGLCPAVSTRRTASEYAIFDEATGKCVGTADIERAHRLGQQRYPGG